jgi:lipopolysaccharide export system protein LptA
MNKKTLFQFFLLFVVLIISIFFFRTYFVKKNTNDISKKQLEKNNPIVRKSNLVHDIEYTSEDKQGNNYIITSKLGEFNDDKPGLILMKNVVATINQKNSTPIKIYSDVAIYNSINYNTKFSENVLITYDENIISSNNLDLFFQENLVTISNDIIYKNLNTELQADKVEINLITKKSKIFMYDVSKKIKIISKN